MNPRIFALFCAGILCSQLASGADAQPPWLEQLGAAKTRSEIYTIYAEANVRVSDGTAYRVNTVYHDPQRAIFRVSKPDQVYTLGVDGKYIWRYEDSVEKQADAFFADIVLGHQFHAQILFYDRLHDIDSALTPGLFEGEKVQVLKSGKPGAGRQFYLDNAGRPLGMAIFQPDQPPITMRFSQWSEAHGVMLPRQVDIDDGERQFEYKFSRIDFNEGSTADFRAPYAALTDEQKLMRRHRIIMDDHLFGRTGGIAEAYADQVTIVSGGEIYDLDEAAAHAGIERIMTSRDYHVYDDVVLPRVKISDDGSLGWVIVQVRAEGVRLTSDGVPTDDLAFTSAWIELYEKVDGDWKMVGNVSNVKYDP